MIILNFDGGQVCPESKKLSEVFQTLFQNPFDFPFDGGRRDDFDVRQMAQDKPGQTSAAGDAHLDCDGFKRFAAPLFVFYYFLRRMKSAFGEDAPLRRSLLSIPSPIRRECR